MRRTKEAREAPQWGLASARALAGELVPEWAPESAQGSTQASACMEEQPCLRGFVIDIVSTMLTFVLTTLVLVVVDMFVEAKGCVCQWSAPGLASEQVSGRALGQDPLSNRPCDMPAHQSQRRGSPLCSSACAAKVSAQSMCSR